MDVTVHREHRSKNSLWSRDNMVTDLGRKRKLTQAGYLDKDEQTT